MWGSCLYPLSKPYHTLERSQEDVMRGAVLRDPRKLWVLSEPQFWLQQKGVKVAYLKQKEPGHKARQ